VLLAVRVEAVPALLHYILHSSIPFGAFPSRSAPCFAACLYACYDILPVDVVMELGWSAHLTDYAMPFLVQATREYTAKVDRLLSAQEEAAKKKGTPIEEAAAAGPDAVTAATPPMAPTVVAPPFVAPPPAAYFMAPMGAPGLPPPGMPPMPYPPAF